MKTPLEKLITRVWKVNRKAAAHLRLMQFDKCMNNVSNLDELFIWAYHPLGGEFWSTIHRRLNA